MNKITVIVLTKAQEAITDILALNQEMPLVDGCLADVPPALAEVPPAIAEVPPVIAEVPPVIADVPPVIAEVPPVIADVPPALAEVPPVIADVPLVPNVPSAPNVPPAPNVVLDSEGLPWDTRIHSMGKTFLIKDGTWKLARGVDSLLVAQIKTELRGTVPQEAVDAGLTWAQLMEKIAETGTKPSDATAACQKFNVANIGILQDRPVLVPLVAKELGF